MNITIEVPEDVARQLEAQLGNISQRASELLAVEAYRRNAITSAQVQQMLKLASRWEVESFLKQEQAYLDYTEADLEQDILAIRKATPTSRR